MAAAGDREAKAGAGCNSLVKLNESLTGSSSGILFAGFWLKGPDDFLPRIEDGK